MSWKAYAGLSGVRCGVETHASRNFVLVAVIVQARRDKHLNP